MTRIAIYAPLGRTSDAHAVLRDAESRMPEFVASFEDNLRKWVTPEMAEHL